MLHHSRIIRLGELPARSKAGEITDNGRPVIGEPDVSVDSQEETTVVLCGLRRRSI